jgi:hypothetical protein
LLTQHNAQLSLPVDQSILKFSKEADLFVSKEEAERLKRYVLLPDEKPGPCPTWTCLTTL